MLLSVLRADIRLPYGVYARPTHGFTQRALYPIYARHSLKALKNALIKISVLRQNLAIRNPHKVKTQSEPITHKYLR